MAITSIADYKTYAGISGSGSDSALTAILAGVEAMLARHTGRTFESAAFSDEEYDGDGSQVLFLKSWPVTVFTSLKFRSSDGTETTIDSTTYRVHDDSGRVSRVPFSRPTRVVRDDYGAISSPGWRPSPNFPEGRGNILVSYTAGYSTMPDDLELTVWQAMDKFFGERGVNPTMLSESEGSYSYTMADVSTTLAPYKAELFRAWSRDGGIFC